MEDYYPELKSTEDVARHYLKNHAATLDDTLSRFAASPRLSEVIERVCRSVVEDNGKIHPHQWRPFHIWPQASDQAIRRLLSVINDIEDSRDFDAELFPTIKKNLAPVTGIGRLARYDFALRIGAWFDPKLEPTEYVYLHRGASEGAKAINIQANNRERVALDEFPARLKQLLTPAQIEDALCIYHGTLARIAGSDEVKVIPRGFSSCADASARGRVFRSGCG